MGKLTDANMDNFIKSVNKYQGMFNLGDWELTIQKNDLTEQQSEASCTWSPSDKLAVITIAAELEGPITKSRLDDLALHEVLELLLSQIHMYARMHIAGSLVEAEIHTIIHRIQRAIRGKGK